MKSYIKMLAYAMGFLGMLGFYAIGASSKDDKVFIGIAESIKGASDPVLDWVKLECGLNELEFNTLMDIVEKSRERDQLAKEMTYYETYFERLSPAASGMTPEEVENKIRDYENKINLLIDEINYGLTSLENADPAKYKMLKNSIKDHELINVITDEFVISGLPLEEADGFYSGKMARNKHAADKRKEFVKERLRNKGRYIKSSEDGASGNSSSDFEKVMKGKEKIMKLQYKVLLDNRMSKPADPSKMDEIKKEIKKIKSIFID